jgi:hypothetical protein
MEEILTLKLMTSDNIADSLYLHNSATYQNVASDNRLADALGFGLWPFLRPKSIVASPQFVNGACT